MNNYFRHMRLVAPVDNGSEGLDINVSAGGSDSTPTGDGEETTVDTSADIEALKAELAKAKAEALRFKNTNDKLLKEKGELTKKNREMMSADQLEKEAQEERDKKFAEMAKELRVNRYSKRLVGLGMSEKEADAFAEQIPEMEDIDGFFTTLGSFIQAKTKEASENAVQELLKNRPEINAGNGDAEKDDPAMEFAKRAVAQRKASANNNFNNIISNFTH